MIGATIHPTPDEQLVLNIARGDREALSEVYLRHKGAVYAFALSILHNAQAAEDVMQETFLQLWTASASYVPRGQSPLSWLLGITRNTALKHLRSEQKTGVALDELPEAADPLDHFSPRKTASSPERSWRSLRRRSGRSSCSMPSQV